MDVYCTEIQKSWTQQRRIAVTILPAIAGRFAIECRDKVIRSRGIPEVLTSVHSRSATDRAGLNGRVTKDVNDSRESCHKNACRRTQFSMCSGHLTIALAGSDAWLGRSL